MLTLFSGGTTKGWQQISYNFLWTASAYIGCIPFSIVFHNSRLDFLKPGLLKRGPTVYSTPLLAPRVATPIQEQPCDKPSKRPCPHTALLCGGQYTACCVLVGGTCCRPKSFLSGYPLRNNSGYRQGGLRVGIDHVSSSQHFHD